MEERTRLHFVHQLESGAFLQQPARNLKKAWEILADMLNKHLADGQLEINYANYRRLIECGIPMGGGKSTGLAVYAAMLAGMAEEPKQCPGLLMVCERIEDCNSQAKTINRLAQTWVK